MKVRQLMHLHTWSVRSDESLGGVVELMADQHLTAVPVVDAGKKVLGVVSVADLLSAQAEALEGAAQWEAETVQNWMTKPALTIDVEAPVREAMQMMQYADVHRIFVTEAGALVGVLSQTDILRAIASRQLNSLGSEWLVA